MPLLSLAGFERSGLVVSDDMFGANVVFSETEDGAPSAAYDSAAQALGVHNIRFGGGQADLSPDAVSDAGDSPIDGVSAINIVTMQNGELRPELVNFLDWCKARAEVGDPVTTTLVIPTKHLSAEAYGAFAEDIETFVTTVMRDYGDVISAFQMGNEYWEMGETAYGIKASLGAEAIARGLEGAGYAPADQPDILVQMGTAGNEGSEFQATPGVRDFNARNTAANETIIEQLSDAARDAIDGVTEHYYYNKHFYEFQPTQSAVKNINKDFAIWSEAFDKELDLHITEWNVKTTAPEQHGIVSASTLIEQFANMIEIGADGAHVWTFDYHSRTALTSRDDGGANLDEQGRLTNSPNGAAFDLMSQSLVGKELVHASFETAVPGIEVVAYASEQEMVFYISSRSFETTNLTLDLAAALPNIGSVTGVQLAIDPSSSNGLQWENGTAADSVVVDGQPYYFNEHDVDVTLTDFVYTDPSAIELLLNPFEVVELSVGLTDGTSGVQTRREASLEPATPEGASFVGSSQDDQVILTNMLQTVDGGLGLDSLSIGAGRSQVDITSGADGAMVLDVPGLPNDVTLHSVERLEFLDGTMAFDLEGMAGQAYRLYEASFDRTPDTEGLGFWISELDSGLSLEEAAAAFIASKEFVSMYGRQDQVSDSEFIDLLYANVLDRTPDQLGYDFWRTQQEDGLSRADILVHFSESAENKDAVAPQIDTGIWFV